ncbi:MAG TPA: D-hexose-6-phosphate mutarotase [Prolixibacteraceae bacterium]|nr:D-hexose-6-phosphate mutarotase [Prolixibacteraceae bacterium]
MIDIDQLDEKFSIEGEVGFAELENDLIFLTVSNKYADVDICLYGAHITSFRPHNSGDLLWMSPESFFEEGKAIRGGIPVCFPWFGPHQTEPQLPQHGFARLMYWDVVETASLSSAETKVVLQLCSSEATKVYWPHDFCATLTVIAGSVLKVTLAVTNTSGIAFDYTCALHSYFNLSAIENLRIEGLQHTEYYNQLSGEKGLQEEEILEITEPMTRHYLDTEAPVVMDDTIFKRRVRVAKAGSRTTTVWNPGAETSAAIADLPDDGFETFICVETVNAFNDVISLAPGDVHETTTMIGLVEYPVS